MPRRLPTFILGWLVLGLFASCISGGAHVDKTAASISGLVAVAVAAILGPVGILTGILGGASTFFLGIWFSTKEAIPGAPASTPISDAVWAIGIALLVLRFRHIFHRWPAVEGALDWIVRLVLGRSKSPAAVRATVKAAKQGGPVLQAAAKGLKVK